MKIRLLLTIIPAGLFTIVSCTNAPESDEAKTTEAKDVNENKTGAKWNVNVSDSKVEWIGTKVSGYHTGIVPIKNGEILMNNGEVTGGKFIMDLANLEVLGPKTVSEANSKKLQGHLRSADFFDVAKYPEGSFELTNVKAYTGDAVKDSADARQDEISEYKVTNPTHLLSGNLTLKGITKNIEFPARITVSANSAEAIAKFNIDRKEWGIIYPGQPDDLIRDAIHLGISIKASR